MTIIDGKYGNRPTWTKKKRKKLEMAVRKLKKKIPTAEIKKRDDN